jgi:hypothetical protein
LYSQKSIDSNVYIFVGDVCVSGNETDVQPPVTEN